MRTSSEPHPWVDYAQVPAGLTYLPGQIVMAVKDAQIRKIRSGWSGWFGDTAILPLPHKAMSA